VHVVRIGAAAQAMILVYFVAGITALPFWLWVSRKTSKHRALCYAGLWGCAWFLLAPFLPSEQVLPVLVLNLMTGAVMAVPPTLGGSMAADVIDLDLFESGWGRAALFVALWSMGTKTAIALGVGIAFPLLSLFGFDPRATNGPAELNALTALYCLLPVALWLVSLLPIWNFPITAERQAALRAAIEGRATAA
jgi:Na+/melibiose symporter-like transporter